jgi:hypothetical protein
MIEADRTRFALAVTLLAENFSANVSPALIALWFRELALHELEDVLGAFRGVVRQRRYTKMPTLADVLDQLGGNVEDRAQVAAARVLEAVRHHGAYRSVSFDDPVIHAVIVQVYGGWVRLCEMGEDQARFFGPQFARAYVSYARSGAARYGHLVGIQESENRMGGFIERIEPPVLIGDHARALEIAHQSERVAIDGPVSDAIAGLIGCVGEESRDGK